MSKGEVAEAVMLTAAIVLAVAKVVVEFEKRNDSESPDSLLDSETDDLFRLG